MQHDALEILQLGAERGRHEEPLADLGEALGDRPDVLRVPERQDEVSLIHYQRFHLERTKVVGGLFRMSGRVSSKQLERTNNKVAKKKVWGLIVPVPQRRMDDARYVGAWMKNHSRALEGCPGCGG